MTALAYPIPLMYVHLLVFGFCVVTGSSAFLRALVVLVN